MIVKKIKLIGSQQIDIMIAYMFLWPYVPSQRRKRHFSIIFYINYNIYLFYDFLIEKAQFDALRKQEEELAEQQEKNRETLKSVSERQSATEERIKFLEQLDKVHPSQKSSDYVNAEEIRLKVDNDNESDISTFELPGVGTGNG